MTFIYKRKSGNGDKILQLQKAVPGVYRTRAERQLPTQKRCAVKKQEFNLKLILKFTIRYFTVCNIKSVAIKYL